MKPPTVFLIHHWRLLIFGITKISIIFQQWFLSLGIAKDKDLTPEYTGEVIERLRKI